MTDDPFGGNDPFSNGVGGGQGLAEFENQHVIITPLEYLDNVKTTNGEKDAIDSDVVALSEDNDPELVEGVRIFSMTLIGRMKRAAIFNQRHGVDPSTGFPKMFVGKLIKDEENKKKGQNAPWSLVPADETFVNKARAYLVENKPKDPFE